MFPQIVKPEEPQQSKNDDKIMYKYKTFLNAQTLSEQASTNSMVQIDELLESEKKTMNTESWNKLDKRLKIQKLHAYAEKYGRENALPVKDVKALKMFFSECLSKDKLSKVKDVEYDKQMGVINSISGLSFNVISRSFTIRNLEKKVSTLKSLTPKRQAVDPVDES
jgi:hypothetical protein